MAKKLTESIEFLKTENLNLKYAVSSLKSENDKFSTAVGILGQNVGNIETAKDELFSLVDDYTKENNKHEANNLVQLFSLVDANSDFKLEREELLRMKEYTKKYYNKDLRLEILDSDENGCVSINEFIDFYVKE